MTHSFLSVRPSVLSSVQRISYLSQKLFEIFTSNLVLSSMYMVCMCVCVCSLYLCVNLCVVCMSVLYVCLVHLCVFIYVCVCLCILHVQVY